MALLVMQQLFYNFQPKTVITVHLSSTTTAAKARHHRVHNLLSSPEMNKLSRRPAHVQHASRVHGQDLLT